MQVSTRFRAFPKAEMMAVPQSWTTAIVFFSFCVINCVCLRTYQEAYTYMTPATLEPGMCSDGRKIGPLKMSLQVLIDKCALAQ
jgi:hypothetical protein